MFLSHQTIERCIDEGSIIIGPDFNKKGIRPVGIRLHLGSDLLIAEPNQVVDLTESKELKYREVNLLREEFFLEPGQFVLAVTYETIQTAPHILAILDGRSTVARLGLTTHITAAIIDGTFESPHAATLEIKNVGNFRIRLKHKDPIALIGCMQKSGQERPVVNEEFKNLYKSIPESIKKIIPQPNFGLNKIKEQEGETLNKIKDRQTELLNEKVEKSKVNLLSKETFAGTRKKIQERNSVWYKVKKWLFG